MIEVIQYRQMDKGLHTVVLCVALFACLVVGATLAYFTASDEKERFIPIERIKLTLDEVWNVDDGVNYQAGLVAVKEPRFTANTGDMYVRVRITIEEFVVDGDGEFRTRVMPAGERLDLIKGILWADMDSAIGAGPYTKEQLSVLKAGGRINEAYDSRYFVNPRQPDSNKAVFLYEYNGVLTQGDSVALFTHVVVPDDYTFDQIALMGNFVVSIDGQGIQSHGFADQAAAMAALDKQNATE
ncbi:MAG: SipW-dependent-type signal peptide-containing protein [Raoultibacter sp.]|jgi:predicted ribosomally synthesized peptide with SipW-like signal peptide